MLLHRKFVVNSNIKLKNTSFKCFQEIEDAFQPVLSGKYKTLTKIL